MAAHCCLIKANANTRNKLTVPLAIIKASLVSQEKDMRKRHNQL